MAEIVPDSSGEEVILNPSSPKKNSKQTSGRKNHFFTYNNYKDEEVAPLVQTLQKFAYKGKVQSEVGANGTKHLQGMIWCHKKHRDTEFKLPKAIHWEKLLDEDNVKDYCGKDDTHDGKHRYSWGFPNPLRIIQILKPWQERIKNICLSPPDDRKIYWFWESTGGIGKTAFIKYMIYHHKVTFASSGKYADIINLVFNSNMDMVECILFNIPRANKGSISYAALECIKDGLICNTKYETGSKMFNPPNMIIFANFPPDNTDEISSDRWVIEEIKEPVKLPPAYPVEWRNERQENLFWR